MPRLSKFLISFLASVFLIFSFVPQVMAAPIKPAPAASPGPWYNQDFGQWSTKVFDKSNPNEIFGERYTFAQVNWIINSLIAVVIGSNISQCIQLGSAGDLSKVGSCAAALGPVSLPSSSTTPLKPTTPNTGMSGGTITGLAYLTGSLVAFRPASGVQYVKTTAERLHVIPRAYAQTGAGFNTLSPIQSLWSVVRDISYTLMVLVIVVMAFMIMFRAKISAQVVITVQSALPKVAIALILITFSYAIAGFLIDFMYVVIGAFAAMVKIGGDKISHGSVVYLFGQLNSINGLVSLAIGLLFFVIVLSIFGFASPIAGTFNPLGLLTAPIGILGGVILLIGAVFILWILLRLLWLLIRTAVVTVLLIIVSPLMILTDAVGVGSGFIGWFRTLAANLAVYPVIIIMLFLSHYFFWGWAMGFFTGSNFLQNINPLNTYAINALDLNGGSGVINLPGMPMGTSVIGFFASFMIIFLIPKAAQLIEGMIQGKGINHGAAIGEAIGPSKAVGLYGATRVFDVASQKAGSTPGWVQTGRRLLGVKGP